MPRKSHRIFVPGLLFASVVLMGCAAKKPVVSTGPSFRFQSFRNGSLLLAPTVPALLSGDTAIKLTLKSEPATSPRPGDCSTEKGPFRLQPASTNQTLIQVTLPAPAQWLNDLAGQPEQDGADGMESLYAFLAAIDHSQQAGCFAEDSAPARDFVMQSLPMKPNESLFNAYGYRLERSGLDLKPGLRLKIERAYFRPAEPEEAEHSIKNYLGVSSINFDVQRSEDRKIHFQQVANIQYSPESLAQTSAEGSRDLGLHDLPQQPHYRLLFYTYLVPKEHRISAAIVGAGSASQLDELEQELRLQPEEGCKRVAGAKGEDCFEFNGFVTLSAQINVELNGKPKFVDWGTTVKDVVPRNSLKSLRIQRQFLGSYYEVRFEANDPIVLSLALVGGDRLNWSRSSATLR
jgi:hypothetical protein